MSIPEFEEIVEPNDQTAARRQHLDALRELVGNVYPNKFVRSKVSGSEDTITSLLHFPPIVGIVDEIKSIVATLAERERPPVEKKDELNARLREFGNVRIAGRLAVPPRVMGKAAFVHLSDGMNRLQIYVRRDDVKGVWNGSVPPAVAGGVFSDAGDKTPPAIAGGTDPLYKSPSATAGGAEKNPPADAGAQNGWAIFQLLDHGDFIGVEGYLFITNTGELSVHVETLQFLAKAMLPMPDKMHGIADPELQRRYRYADLIASSLQVERQGLTTREVFERRAKLVSGLRRFLDDAGFIEVETPMLTPKATGAAAKPFETHHNALDIPLYARVAPELYLKRLVVGGFEKVYELNRNFRNEGLSQRHNPEFTMLEFYVAYMDVNGMMDFCEKILQESVQKSNGGLTWSITKTDPRVAGFGSSFEVEADFSFFPRISMRRAVIEFIPSLLNWNFRNVNQELGNRVANWLLVEIGDDWEKWLSSHSNAKALLDQFNWLESFSNLMNATVDVDDFNEIHEVSDDEAFGRITKELNSISLNCKSYSNSTDESVQTILTIFDSHIEQVVGVEGTGDELTIRPTFIIDYPKSISPLSKASPDNPQVAERFELFINGMEVANGFSELNDPKEQYERFVDQMSERERGDEEAMILDEDYIRALSYGMPPAAGIGIGVDRLVMLLTNRHSIRDVILFPHMRPERNQATEDTESREEE